MLKLLKKQYPYQNGLQSIRILAKKVQWQSSNADFVHISDGIGPKLLKHCAIALYQPLHHLFCESLAQQIIPFEWRTHLIKPIFKTGDRSSVKNYRPISLLCVTSKVLEKIVYNHIIEFVTNNISVSQFGFLRNLSTLQQLLIFINTVNDSLNSNSQADVLYLDFKKAFDSVAHNELLFKLWSFGITGNLWRWLQAYLSNRVQQVSVNNTVSDVLPVVSGVPQGSILGPILFLVFVNDIPAAVSSSLVLLFADDAKCIKSVSQTSDCLSFQQDLNNLVTWSTTWNLPFNDQKCSMVRFYTNHSPLQYNYHLNSVPVAIKTSHTDLGIIVTSDLQWKSHHLYIISKSYKFLGLLRRVFSSVTCTRAKKILYLSLVRSKLLYCSPIWRPHLLADIKALENVQRRATKYILNDHLMDYRHRLVSLSLLPLMMIFEIKDIIFFIKCLKQPSKWFNILDFVTFCSGHTRSSTYFKLRHSFSRKNYIRHFYFYRLPRLWNSLPYIDIHQSESTIKKKLKRFMWSHFINNFDSDNVCTYHLVCPCAKCSLLPVSYNFDTSFL